MPFDTIGGEAVHVDADLGDHDAGDVFTWGGRESLPFAKTSSDSVRMREWHAKSLEPG
jgi:hypothetical protein